jgi:hypothetical protein
MRYKLLCCISVTGSEGNKEEHPKMNRRAIMFASFLSVALLSFFVFGGTSPARAADDLTTASVNGKYQNLLMTVYVPQDNASYGSFYDWGYSTTSSWAGYNNLPPGYWVYVYPNWYIWGNTGTGGNPNLVKASVNGKYYNLLKVINVPSDRGSYGDFSDYGHYSSTSYAGYNNLPAGYWVYVYPDWYIWGNSR